MACADCHGFVDDPNAEEIARAASSSSRPASRWHRQDRDALDTWVSTKIPVSTRLVTRTTSRSTAQCPQQRRAVGDHHGRPVEHRQTGRPHRRPERTRRRSRSRASWSTWSSTMRATASTTAYARYLWRPPGNSPRRPRPCQQSRAPRTLRQPGLGASGPLHRHDGTSHQARFPDRGLALSAGAPPHVGGDSNRPPAHGTRRATSAAPNHPAFRNRGRGRPRPASVGSAMRPSSAHPRVNARDGPPGAL